MGFFDKIKEQASELGAQLDGALKGTKSAAQLSSLSKQREEMARQLGNFLLDQFRAGGIDEAALRAEAERVFEVERQIIALRQQIEAEKQAAAAARAAAAQPPAPPAAGARAAAPPPPTEAPAASHPAPPGPQAAAAEGMVACAGCGKEMPADAAFCPECGTRRQ